MTDPHRERYAADLEAGLAFEDFVYEVLYLRGLPIVAFRTAQGQRRGENLAGFEVKYDRKFAQTRRLFIETAECPRPGMKLAPAGIYADDNSWMYVIGNRSILFLFAHSTLRFLHELKLRGAWRFERTEIPTARGFLLPESAARRFAARVIELEINGARGS